MADVIHSRFAYFFGPETEYVRSCEPGIREALRLLKPGGAFFVIQNNLVDGDFANFLSYMYAHPAAEEERTNTFWRDQGFKMQTVPSSWSAPNRDILRRIMEMEFRAERVDGIMARVPEMSLSYYYNVFYYVNEKEGAPPVRITCSN